jgi:hypothetical protein
MLYRIPTDKINAAVADCVNECIGAKDPLAAFTAYFDRLKHDPNWTAAEVEEIGVGLSRILVAASAERRKDDGIEPPIGTVGH